MCKDTTDQPKKPTVKIHATSRPLLKGSSGEGSDDADQIDGSKELSTTSDAFRESIGMNAHLPEYTEDDEGHWHFKANSIPQITKCFGTKSPEFMGMLLENCLNVSGRAEKCKQDKNYAISVISEIAPTDAIEGMLAVQMASIHLAMMRHSRMMAGSDTIERLEIHERVVNKLARTFTMQAEALRKHRTGGEQKMTVEHVTVNDGGQAIVGNVGGRQKDD